MSEPDSPTRGDLHHQHQQLHQSSSQHSADERDDANNSIMGKVKSRVSSIFPQKLTKWFSPSTTVTATTSSNGGVGRRRRRNEECEGEEYGRANNSDDESNNSADDMEDAFPASTQPPTKRSRLNIEVTRTNYESFLSSTPTSGGRRRLTHSNLYGKQKEPAYNFSHTNTITNTSRSYITTKNSTVDSADIIEVVPERNLNTSISSSRRSLNIPSTPSTEGYRNVHDLKRQSVSNLRASGTGASPSTFSYTPQRTPTITILELDDDDDDDDEGEEPATQTIIVDEGDEDEHVDEEDDNEESEEIAKVTSKKRKFTNGNLVGRSSSVATESGESRSSSVAQAGLPKSGLFNSGNRNLRSLSGNGLNFYSHLEGRKSLFSEKNMPGMLNNSTLSLTSLNRRQFNSSIYGSTSALSDSRLLNISSPFYKGQTTYGGAAAYNKYNRTLNQSVRIAPTLIRPTSSLSTLSSSTNSLAQGNDQSSSTISSTAKRILELINDFSTPLNDAKKMASNIKSPATLASRNVTGKRFSEADLATSRSVRLSAVRTPYTRPIVTLNPNSSHSMKTLPPLKELQVPSMSQLLQMKKMQSCTERSRQIANTSKSALNRECEYKLPGGDDEGAAGDKNSSKHVSKIKNKVSSSSRVSLKNTNANNEEAPEPANLPNIAFPFMESVPKIDITVKSVLPVSPAKTDFKFEVSSEAKPTNNFSFGVGKKASEVKNPTPAPSTPVVNFNFGTTTSTRKAIVAINEYKFSSPQTLSSTPSKGDITPIKNFKFSSPVIVDGQNEIKKVVPTSTSTSTIPQLKTGSVLDALKKPIEKVTPIILSVTKSPATTAPSIGSSGPSLFGGQFKKPSSEWECSVCMVRNKETVDSCAACTTSRTKPVTATAAVLPLSNSLVKNTFGDVFKPKSNTWECSACMVRNKNEANECVACNTKKPGATTTAPSAKLQTTDVGFKSLVAQQTASKWECDACMTRNDAERNKCVCCEQAKPGTQVISENVPKFNFGTSGASKFTFGFGNAGAEKEDELKAEVLSKTENKTGFTFGMPAKTDAGSSSVTSSPVTSTGIVFGTKPVIKPTSSVSVGKDVPDVVKTNAAGFKFGVQSVDSSKPDAATTSAGFSFGVKLDDKPTSVKFNIPATTAESKTVNFSSPSSVAVPSFFSSIDSSAFGAVQKAEDTKSNPAEKNKVSSEFVLESTVPVSISKPATTATATNLQSLAVKANTFSSSSMVDATKSPPKIVFGNPTTVTAANPSSTSSTSSGFVFGKSVTTTSAFSKSPSTSSDFVFGKHLAGTNNPSLFELPTSSSISVNSKSTAPISGNPDATSNVPAAVSSSSTGSVFGSNTNLNAPQNLKPMFGTRPIESGSAGAATTSVFGSKPSVFPSGAAASSSTPVSTISSTLATNASSISTVPSTPFVFGSSTLHTSQNLKHIFGPRSSESGSAAAASTITAASSWSTNTFTFSSNKLAEEVTSNATHAPAFGSPASIFGQATPCFGSTQVVEVKPNIATPLATPVFGAQPATTSLFGSNATSASAGAGAVQQTSGNVFGSTNPIFGSGSFGAAPVTAGAPAPQASNNNRLTAATFGSMGSASFSSGFGSLAAASLGSGDDASGPKKATPSFNFASVQSSENSGFSFGSNNKPPGESVFQFTTSSAPSYNFTGTNEPSNATQPFLFGAPTSTAPVFNFGGVEGSNSSGPFQFNAAAPAAATNNIFAPMQTPGSQAASQQARRKMRTPNRRMTPR